MLDVAPALLLPALRADIAGDRDERLPLRHQAFDAGEQHGRRQRLHQDEIDAAGRRPVDRRGIAIPGHEDDRHDRIPAEPIVADVDNDVDSVAIGRVHVENEQIRRRSGNHLAQGREAADRPHVAVAFMGERVPQPLPHVGMAVRQEDLHAPTVLFRGSYHSQALPHLVAHPVEALSRIYLKFKGLCLSPDCH